MQSYRECFILLNLVSCVGCNMCTSCLREKRKDIHMPPFSRVQFYVERRVEGFCLCSPVLAGGETGNLGTGTNRGSSSLQRFPEEEGEKQNQKICSRPCSVSTSLGHRPPTPSSLLKSFFPLDWGATISPKSPGPRELDPKFSSLPLGISAASQ